SLAWLDTGEIHARIASTRYLAGVHDPLSGHLHPLKYCLGLADAARREGVALYARTPSGEVRCRFVVSCCNAGPGGVLPA
ncbi:FAD-dependent oxidoreductase, partial [Burkholderia cenocepacia]|uniref:FAD-dependent oxidoreductase n=1 Tax=Burkholderia cenocepacia TaxID=95486 RepID=UPI0024B6F410